ncbi:MAG: glycoside hydrolase family 88 protein [Verrucomicrobia bacterium]|nr:glycoside hydrolase family 88 protein [Verrucomicrobiota bacterium]
MSTGHPELAIVTQQPEDPLMLSLVSQFLENEVYFYPGGNQELLREAPDVLESYKAVAFDQPSFDAAMKNVAWRKRLVAFAGGQGFLLCMKPPQGADPRDFNTVLMMDHLTFAQAHDLILCAGLTRFHPELRQIQLARADQQLLDEIKPRIIRSVEGWEGWHEFNLYYWKAAQRLFEAGHEDARLALIAGIRNAARNIPSGLNHDYFGGYFGAVWLHEQTGDRAPLEKALTNVDDVIARRPRNMGVLTSCGYADDPLGFKNQPQGLEMYYNTNWITARRLIWTEAMLMHGPTFGALARATGKKKYREEVSRLVSHLARHHQRDDGLLWHCTRDGRSGGGAWTRGQSHALLGMVFLLEELDRQDPLAMQCIELIRRVSRALLRHQDVRTGMWRNLIDVPSARLETSGTTIFAMVFARGINEGWLDRAEFEPAVRRAWEGVKTRYWRGRLAGWCRGTAGAVDDAYYLARPQGGSSGASIAHLLLALLEIQRLQVTTQVHGSRVHGSAVGKA